MAVTQSRLKQLLEYDPDLGSFTWLVPQGTKSKGAIAGYKSVHSKEYIVIGIDGRVYKAHRLAWLYQTGLWPTGQIDHRNQNKSDNRWDNLRLATNSQNKANGNGWRLSRRSLPLPKGVYRNGGKFVAQVRVDGKCHYLGIYYTPEEAAAAYDAAAQMLHGEFAKCNKTINPSLNA